MTVKAEEYRAKALQCEVDAATAKNGSVKEQLRDMARQWRELAKHAEKYGR